MKKWLNKYIGSCPHGTDRMKIWEFIVTETLLLGAAILFAFLYSYN